MLVPAATAEKSRIALAVHYPQQIEQLRQGGLRIQPRIGRPAAAIVAGLTLLGLVCSHHLAVAIEPGQEELLGGLGLQGRHSSTSS